MSRTPRRSDDDDDEPSSPPPPTEQSLVPRRPTERAQLRAALALEEAGELQEAARLFEYVGEHAQAASLRLEHADTLRDEQQRLAVLREGCARNPASSDQGQALHRALGEALLRVAEGIESGARKRALVLEAAGALETGRRGAQAGRLYERLGLLARAARAYTEAGEIDRLEAVYKALDQREQAERELRELEFEVEAAMSIGRRSLALAIVQQHVHEAVQAGRSPRASLLTTLAELERRTTREGRLGVIVRDEAGASVVRVVGRERLRIGRAPHCELTVDGVALSREHAELILVDAALALRDLGSRAGTFVDGLAIELGEDWPIEPGDDPVELALGIAASFVLHHPRAAPGEEPHPVALLRASSIHEPPDRLAHAWILFSPRGGSLWTSPTQRLPVTLEFVEGRAVLTAAPDVRVSLRDEPIGLGASVELLIQDRLRFEPAEGPAFELEILE